MQIINALSSNKRLSANTNEQNIVPDLISKLSNKLTTSGTNADELKKAISTDIANKSLKNNTNKIEYLENAYSLIDSSKVFEDTVKKEVLSHIKSLLTSTTPSYFTAHKTAFDRYKSEVEKKQQPNKPASHTTAEINNKNLGKTASKDNATEINKPIGMVNRGNDCFAISGLQLLLNNPKMIKSFLDLKYDANPINSKKSDQLINAQDELKKYINAINKETSSSKPLIEAMRAYTGMPTGQNSSTEFLNRLFAISNSPLSSTYANVDLKYFKQAITANNDINQFIDQIPTSKEDEYPGYENFRDVMIEIKQPKNGYTNEDLQTACATVLKNIAGKDYNVAKEFIDKNTGMVNDILNAPEYRKQLLSKKRAYSTQNINDLSKVETKFKSDYFDLIKDFIVDNRLEKEYTVLHNARFNDLFDVTKDSDDKALIKNELTQLLESAKFQTYINNIVFKDVSGRRIEENGKSRPFAYKDIPSYDRDKLNTFIVYNGDIENGHYYSYIKKDNQWYKCNDDNVGDPITDMNSLKNKTVVTYSLDFEQK